MNNMQREIIKCFESPDWFALHHVYTNTPRGWISYNPTPTQSMVLEADMKVIADVWGRQSGKSLTLFTKALHTVIFKEYQTVLFVTANHAQAKYSKDTFLSMYEKLDDTFKLNKMINNNVSEIAFDNGSRIVFKSHRDVVAHWHGAVHLMLCDEYRYWNDTFEEKSRFVETVNRFVDREIWLSS